MPNPTLQEMQAGVAENSTPLYGGPKEIEAMLAQGGRKKVITYLYTHPETQEAELACFRVEPGRDGRKKDFFQAAPIPTTAGQGWELKAPKGPLPLYNRRRMLKATTVIVVEGEKCVHALHDLGIVATTSPGGANAADKADWSPLRNKEVFIWPDPDAAGAKYADAVYGAAKAVNARCYLVHTGLMGLTEKEDAFEFCAKAMAEASGDKALAKRIVLDAIAEASTEITEPAPQQGDFFKEVGASDEVETMLRDMATGKHAVCDMPWTRLSELTNALKPGTMTVICGDPGDGKSFLLLQVMAHLHDQGVKTATFELEEDRAYFLHRTLAQRAKAPQILDDKWVREFPEQAIAIHREHAPWLDSFGETMSDAPDKVATYDTLLKWIEKQCKAGIRVMAIDPITAIETGKDGFKEDSNFVLTAKTLMRQYKASLVIVTHPRGGGEKKNADSDDLAGGRAWSRFTQTVIWIKKHDDDHGSEVFTHSLTSKYHQQWETFNREVRMVKTRNGKGWRHGIAFTFRKDSLTFQEHGPIIPPAPEAKKKGKRNAD